MEEGATQALRRWSLGCAIDARIEIAAPNQRGDATTLGMTQLQIVLNLHCRRLIFVTVLASPQKAGKGFDIHGHVS